MKQYIQITKNNKNIYDGRIGDIPIKQKYIIQKSIDLFDDDDPCIIHQSYVIKEYVDIILSIFKCIKRNEISVKDHLDELDFIDFTELEKLTIFLKG